jgi:methionyl-tRNA formyltransferase
LLPKYRGAAPIQHALLNQEDSTGVSTFLIEPKVDTGKIIDQLKIEITKDDNYGSLSKKLSEAGADLIESSINKCLHHSSELIEQDNSMATLAPKISKDDLKINWSDKSDTILAKVRAFSPTPGAFTTINSKRLKIFKAESINNDNNHEIGSIYHVDKNFFDVQCGQNALRLHNVQLEGKKAMDSKDFIVGYQDLGSNILI